jgi:hypothetical protein
MMRLEKILQHDDADKKLHFRRQKTLQASACDFFYFIFFKLLLTTNKTISYFNIYICQMSKHILKIQLSITIKIMVQFCINLMMKINHFKELKTIVRKKC